MMMTHDTTSDERMMPATVSTPAPQRLLHPLLAAVLLAVAMLGSAGFVTGCGETFDTGKLGVTRPPDTFGDTTYILQQPLWTGFNAPADVHVGYEPFIYVAERGADRIAMLDLAGALVGRSAPVLRPTAIGQDHRLQLLVCGEFDTTIGGTAVTFGAVYRIDLYAARHDIARAAVRRVYWEPVNPARRFTGVGVLADNSYYIARTGPNNASIIDPDDAVLYFTRDDVLQTRAAWPTLSADGTGLGTITRPTGIAVFPKPGTDFVFTQSGEKSLFRTQWMTRRTTGDISQWESYYQPDRDGDIPFLRVNLFHRPEDATIDAGGSMFVIDAGSDSLYRFNNSGFITQAFGGASQFNAPEGVAFFDKTLYIADTGNNRILRFILSTDLQ